MDLVEDNHLAGEGKSADEEVFHGYDTLKRLVNRAHAVRCEQSLLGGCKPRPGLLDGFARIIAVFFFASLERRTEPEIKVVLQPRVAVSQAQGGIVCQGVAEKAFDAPVNAVARHLRGQREIDSLLLVRRDELLPCCTRTISVHAGQSPSSSARFFVSATSGTSRSWSV